MSARLFAGAAVASYGLYRWLTPASHDELVEKTHDSLVDSTGEEVSVFTDFHHYHPESAAGNTRTLDLGFTHHPDHVVHSGTGSPNLVIEVETNVDALNSEARSQLRDFRSSGYQRVLAVPKSAVDAAEKFVSPLEGAPVEVKTPTTVPELL
jgi:hypothetical protein